MLLELHAHSSRYSSCSRIDPVALIQRTLKKGLQGIVLTEHHYQWPDDELGRLRVAAGVPSYFRILAGQEVDTDIGHVLVFGSKAAITERTRLDDLRQLYPDAALVWAHPFRNGRVPTDEQLCDPRLDGIEIISLNQSTLENYRGLRKWHELRFTATCGSDTHGLAMAGVFPSQFDHPVNDISDVAREIKRNRCRPLLKEIPKAGSDMTVTEVSIGTKGDDEQRQRIIIRNISDERRWIKSKESAHITSLLYNAGFHDSTFRVPRIIDVNDNERLIIEEGQRGDNLFDVLCGVAPEVGEHYFTLAAEWLGRFHSLALRISGVIETMNHENWRFASYKDAFVSTGNSHRDEAQRLLAFIEEREKDLFARHQDSFVQCHGDYHPKNIFLGQDRKRDPSTMYISVIDFNNSLLFSPAFDVGYFLAQFRSQFMDYPAVLDHCSDDLFISAYFKTASFPSDRESFMELADLFKLRAYLSIGAYLVKVGKGESREMAFVFAAASDVLHNCVA